MPASAPCTPPALPMPALPAMPASPFESAMRELVREAVREAVAELLPALQGQPAPASLPDILTTRELSAYIKRPPSWIYQNIRTIPHIKNSTGSRTRYRRRDIDQWLARKEVRVA